MNKVNILVTGTGSLIGQAIIKSIKKSSICEKVELIGCDYFEGTVGSYWCDRNHILPDLLKAEEQENWKNKLYEIVESESIKVIFIGVDFELPYFANLKEEISNRYDCTVVVSDKKVIDIGNDKYLTYGFLKENNLNAPKTVLLEEYRGNNIDFPIIIKPRCGARSRGVELIDDDMVLESKIRELTGKNYIVQQAIGNADLEYTCGILYWNKQFENSIVLKRRLKEGNTVFAECNLNKETRILDYIRAIGDKLLPFGSCNLQLRIDDNGEPYLFEINPRFSGTTYMRALLGFNEVEYIICRALDNNTEFKVPVLNLGAGKVYRYYEEKLTDR